MRIFEKTATYTVREATVNDAEAIQRIYEPFVLHTTITFEEEVPSIEEMGNRIRKTLQTYPYIVIETNGVIGGYAYAKPFRPRSAYAPSVESSIYVDKKFHGRGFGRILYTILGQLLRDQGITNICACVGAAPEGDDPYVDENSIAFHTHMGFRQVGRFNGCASKFNRWYDMVWMVKRVASKQERQCKFKPYSEMFT